jgi:hypothetical protein
MLFASIQQTNQNSRKKVIAQDKFFMGISNLGE